jgi:hypothetical protein
MSSVVELSPVVKTIDVRRSAADAFRLFTAEMTGWWPLKTHSRARDADGEVTERVDVEPRVGGRVNFRNAQYSSRQGAPRLCGLWGPFRTG